MMKQKNWMSLFLLGTLMLSACGESPAEPVATDGGTSSASETTAPVTEAVISDDLPDKDYGGYEFRILCDPEYIHFVYADEQTGEQINDMLFEANNIVEERFHVALTHIAQDTWNDMNPIRKMILSGEDSFDVAFTHDIGAGNLSLEKLFWNLYEVPHLNFEKPWWPKYTVDTMTLNNQMYLISNYMSYYGFHSTRTIFFNRDLVAANDLDDPYQLVENDQWTLDKLIEMTKDFYTDTNGDGKRDFNDIYGFAMTVPYALFENLGYEAWGKTDDGKTLFLDTYSEKTAELMDKLCDWLIADKQGTLYSSSHSGRYEPDSSNTMFSNGNVLYTYGAIGHLIKGLTGTNTNYGILPMPKTDDSQEAYICACTELPGVIPTTASDIDRTGMIIEAMSAESYNTVIPRYYEYALKGRYANDEESVKMLDIMFANRVLSFSYIYGGGGDCFQMIVNNILGTNGNFASYYEKHKGKEQKRIDKVNEFFSGTGES